MKKQIAIFFSVVLSVALVAALGGCGGGNLEKYGDKLSDYRHAALRVTDDRFVLDVISGRRETPYVLDGASSGDKADYTVFTLKPRGDYAADLASVPLSVTVGGGEYELQLSPHPFKDSYSTEIAVALGGDECAALALSLNGEQLTASACAPDAVDGEYALTVALDAAAESLKGLREYEIYLRLTENTISAAGGWYWFASFAASDANVSVLMSATDGSVAAIRK